MPDKQSPLKVECTVIQSHGLPLVSERSRKLCLSFERDVRKKELFPCRVICIEKRAKGLGFDLRTSCVTQNSCQKILK